jgi:hypothetical protein
MDCTNAAKPAPLHKYMAFCIPQPPQKVIPDLSDVSAIFYPFEIDVTNSKKAKNILMRVGFEPTPFRTSVLGLTLSWRLRPLGHLTG